MSDSAVFLDLLARARTGDADAAADLVRRFEGPLRRVVRFRLSGAGRGPATESDVCQSVFGSLFVRLAAGEYEVPSADDLWNLLVRMAGNKAVDLARKNTAARRDGRRESDADPDAQPAPSGVGSPVRVALGKELLAEVRRRLTPDERVLFDRRAEGWGWAEIAADVGGAEPALRQRLARAVRRVEGELGLDGAD